MPRHHSISTSSPDPPSVGAKDGHGSAGRRPRGCLPPSRAASRCVCKAWRDVIDDWRLLHADLLPHSVRGIFIEYQLLDYTAFLARPSTGPAVAGGLDYLLDRARSGFATVLDHCNGLLIYRDSRGLHVINPATQHGVCLPPPPCDEVILNHIAHLVFDPAESPHYEVFLVPDNPHREEKINRCIQANSSASTSIVSGELSSSTAEDREQPDDRMPPGHYIEWPPLTWVLCVFSSRTQRWEERAFSREGKAAGMVADMPWREYSSWRGYAVYWQDAVYVQCNEGELIMRISLSNVEYRIIEMPSDIEWTEHSRFYLGKSEKGVSFASFHDCLEGERRPRGRPTKDEAQATPRLGRGIHVPLPTTRLPDYPSITQDCIRNYGIFSLLSMLFFELNQFNVCYRMKSILGALGIVPVYRRSGCRWGKEMEQRARNQRSPAALAADSIDASPAGRGSPGTAPLVLKRRRRRRQRLPPKYNFKLHVARTSRIHPPSVGKISKVMALPDDALAGIFRRLAPRSLAASRCVCKAWRDAIHDRRLLRADLLPHSVRGIFIKYQLLHYPAFLARPSTGPGIAGGLDYLLDRAQSGFATVLDHCNGLLLYRDSRGLHVINPATQHGACLPPPPCDEVILNHIAHLVFDPAESPHYEVFLVPDNPHREEKINKCLQVNRKTSASIVNGWTPIQQLSSSATKDREQPSSSANETMSLDRLIEWPALTWLLISLSNDKYIEMPSDVEWTDHSDFYLRKSEKGLSFASFHDWYDLWDVSNNKDDDNPSVKEKNFEWDSDNDDVINVEYEAAQRHHGEITVLGFHPYKDVVFLNVAARRAVAYHLNCLVVQDLGNIFPKDYDAVAGVFAEILMSFPYTPCLMEFPDNNLEGHDQD
ncbi:hypothetical protein PR202_gb14604 [Eleusine coracana subsp. coracana]|uniref:F-box domain-containing protein n=1 Tax=Eleusine coracana subsp. coracana TaxID=191504 RepID=A0AAV5EWU0_ELECO|nr:hypothetical protein PR202_gb14604 [Eleusine coracana subsp. coracana]